MGLGTLAMGAAPSSEILFLGRLLVGAGASVTFVGALKIAATWFPSTQFGTLSAITATVGVAGALAGTAPFAALVAMAGWRGALGLIGLGTLGGAVLCAAVVRDRPPAAAGSAQPDLGEVVRGTRAVLGNPHTWPPFFAFLFLYAASSNLMLWVVPYLRDVYGLATTEAALYATASSFALLVAGPLTGFLSDRVVRRRKLPYTVLTSAQLILWLVLVLTVGVLPLGSLYLLFFLMGLVGGAFVLTWPLGREVNPPALAGIAVAVVNMGAFLGAALTQGPIGALLDARWAGQVADGARVYPPEAYRAAFSACAGFLVLAVSTTLFLRETRGANVHATLGRPGSGRTP
jgi:MFS family permease